MSKQTIHDQMYIVDFSNTSLRIANSLLKDIKQNRTLWATLPKPVKISKHEQIKTGYFGYMLQEILNPIRHSIGSYVCVIATEAGRPTWRYKAYGDYKHNRSKVKAQMPFEFSDLVNVVEQELLDMFRELDMFIVIEDTKHCEGDDYIGALLNRNTCMDNKLLSTDTDFLQLSYKTEIYSMYAKNGNRHKKLSRPESELYLRKKIFTGDSGDGIKAVYPRFSGPKKTDEYLTSGLVIDEEVEGYLQVLVEKSQAITKAKPEGSGVPVARNHRLNTLLIDLEKIPPTISNAIVREYVVKRQRYAPNKNQLINKLCMMGLSKVLTASNEKRHYQ